MAKFEKGKVFEQRGLVNYVDGGVVSKELIHNVAGSVTLFSFDAGQGLSEHFAPFDHDDKGKGNQPSRIY